MAFAKMRVAQINNGTGIKVIKANCQSVKNINRMMRIKDSKSAAISIMPEEKTSVMASISDTTLVTIAPTGFLSK